MHLTRKLPIAAALAAALACGFGLRAQEPLKLIVGEGENPACTLEALDALYQLPPNIAQIRSALDGAPPGCPGGAPRGHATRHFDLRGSTAPLVVPVSELGALFDEIFDYVAARTGTHVDGLIPVTVYPVPVGHCPPRGRASRQHIELYAGASTSRAQLLGVFAHELGHVLQFRELPAISRLPGQFVQGYASWAAGRYWTDWQGYDSLHAAVRDYVERGQWLPLSSPPETGFIIDPDAAEPEDCILRRDILLSEWASLIDYLVERDGHEGFYARAEAVPDTGANGDYRAVFGRELAELEADWLSAIGAQR